MTHLATQITSDYAAWLASLKAQIRMSRVKAGLAVNQELVMLYWRIGCEIVKQRASQAWGSKILDQLAKDLRSEFPDMRGLSTRNMQYMRAFAEAWPDESIVHQLGAQLPWKHNCTILDQIKEQQTREWYIKKTIENGWSRSVLELQIETEAHVRFGAAQNNFAERLPAPESDLARDILKDPYAFDFLGITEATNERAIERGLVANLRDFLVELGVGFAFVGSQYKLDIAGTELYIDLLFYHTKLHCYVVIELKNTEFKFAYTGQLNGYLAAVDDLVRDKERDAPTIGLILCKSKNEMMVEYALRGVETPMGVSTFRTALPESVLDVLPSIETLSEKLQTLSLERLP